MRLIIDCFKLVKGAGKSIGIYNLAKSLTHHLGEMALDNRNDSIIVFGNSINRMDFDVPGVTFVEIPKNPANKLVCILWELFEVVHYAQKYKADRILFPRGFRPLFTGFGKRRIADTIIIHDLIPFYYHEHYPGYFNRLENAYIMNRLLSSMKHADRIVTISDCSKNDIMKRVPSAKSRITVIYNGFNDVNYDKKDKNDENDKNNKNGASNNKSGESNNRSAEACIGKLNSGCYIVAMTSSLPHKNPGGILAAYEEYYKTSEDPLDLVVIGIGDPDVKPDLADQVKEHIHYYKFIKNFEEMCRLVAGGRAYLFLSFAEGFGFPPLEAMQLGLPVVCSNRSSLPEVVQEAGILIDPDDYRGIADALRTVTKESSTREELIQKGFENIRRFSWDSRTRLYWEELFR